MFDVTLAGVELLDLGGVDVEAEDGVADLGVAQHERQADVAEAKDADLGLFGVEAGEEVHGGGVRGGVVTAVLHDGEFQGDVT